MRLAEFNYINFDYNQLYFLQLLYENSMYNKVNLLNTNI